MIYEDLPVGPANGITAEEIMRRYGIDDPRDLRRQIREERLHGKPILNKGAKYFRSDDPLDFKLWGTMTTRKGVHTIEVVKAVMAKCPDTSGQITIRELMQAEEDEA